MRHPETGSARIIMRREKTMRVGKKGEIIITLDAPQMCANHSILPWMDLRPNCGSQKVHIGQIMLLAKLLPFMS